MALILLGVAGYVWGMIDGNASVTALIPAFFGIVIAILGAVAKSNENLRKHLMHAAVMIALIGFLVPAIRILMKLGSISFSAAFLSQLVMALLCLVFLVLGIQSFINARRSGAV
ncbi:MAG: hypothetical protein JSS81_01325 [Acidobacteria bacterium]|nr:hypothetical protein [Acidobacteriota bacterium]